MGCKSEGCWSPKLRNIIMVPNSTLSAQKRCKIRENEKHWPAPSTQNAESVCRQLICRWPEPSSRHQAMPPAGRLLCHCNPQNCRPSQARWLLAVSGCQAQWGLGQFQCSARPLSCQSRRGAGGRKTPQPADTAAGLVSHARAQRWAEDTTACRHGSWPGQSCQRTAALKP